MHVLRNKHELYDFFHSNSLLGFVIVNMITSNLVIIAAVNIVITLADTACILGDRFCAAVEGEGSYCKYWSTPPVCHGSFHSVCSCEDNQEFTIDDHTLAQIKLANEHCQREVDLPTYCRFWDEEPTCHGSDHVKCAFSTHSSIPVAQDPCFFETGIQLSDILWASSTDAVKACLESTTITHSQALWTLHNLLYGVSEGYSYTKLAVNSTMSDFDNNCHFPIYNVSIDIETELKSQIGQYTIRLDGMSTMEEQMVFLRTTRPAYAFHTDLVRTFNSLRDAHTTYTSPYSMITLFYPFGLDSHIAPSGEQIITVRFNDTDSLQTIASVFKTVYNESLPTYLHGGRIEYINNMDPITFLIDQVSNAKSFDHMYHGLNQRVNQFFFVDDTISISVGSQVWPDFDTLDLVVVDPTTQVPTQVSLPLVARVVGDDSWSPKSGQSFNDMINQNSEFTKFLEYDQETNPELSSLWRLTAATSERKHAKHESLNRRLMDNFSSVVVPEDSPDMAIFEFIESRKLEHASRANVPQSPSPPLTAQFSNDTVIVRIPSFFVPKNEISGTYFEEMIRVQSLAKSAGISRILIDVSRNSGGYIPASNALSWFFVQDVEDICQPVAKRMTWNWQSWLQSFGLNGALRLLRDLELEGGFESLGKQYNEVLFKIENFINFYETVLKTKSNIHDNFARLKQEITLADSDYARGYLIVDFLTSTQDGDLGLYPFWTGEVGRWDGTDDEPRTRIFTDLTTVKWGREFSQITQKRPFRSCIEIVGKMENEFAHLYDRNYWTNVAIVSDGGCGSACSQFVTGMQLGGVAKIFTYGGIAGMNMDASSFTGGSVNKYESHWRKVSVSERFGDLITLGKSEWSRLHAETWVHSPMPFPHRAKASFNWNMIFFTKLGTESLPREYYEIPSDKHLALWAHDDDGMQRIYRTIINLDWDMIKSNHTCQAQVQTPEFTI